MRNVLVFAIVISLIVPVVADSHVDECEERLREVEQRMEQRVENISSSEERRRVIEEYEERLSAMQDECEALEATQNQVRGGESASQPAQDVEQPRDLDRGVTRERIVEWSEGYPDLAPIPVGGVSLSDEQFSTVKENVLTGLGKAEEHLPDELAQDCVEDATDAASDAREQVQDITSLDRIMEVHRELTQEIEGILSSEDCRPSTSSSGISSSIEQAEVLSEVGPGSSLSESQIRELREQFLELQQAVTEKQQRIKQLERQVESLQDEVESLEERLARRGGSDEPVVAGDGAGVVDAAEEPRAPDRVRESSRTAADESVEESAGGDERRVENERRENTSSEDREARQTVREAGNESPGDEVNRSNDGLERGGGNVETEGASSESAGQGLLGQVADALFG